MAKWLGLPSILRPSGLKRSQLELPLERVREPDRNHQLGGRSFYFFDFDDNVAFLTTPMFLFHRETGSEVQISSREFAQASALIGKSGVFADYVLSPDPKTGSFRAFRDKDLTLLEKLLGKRQIFVQDLAAALGQPDLHWQGPSWSCFYHAVFNSRPMALITARGHRPETIKQGIRLWVKEGHLPHEPNYLAVYPVSHPEVKRSLQLEDSQFIPELKQRALRAAILKALAVYGHNPHHRFGMSDDDPSNIEWIIKEMKLLKNEFPLMSFFVIQTHGEKMIKHEVFPDRVEDVLLESATQMNLFSE